MIRKVVDAALNNRFIVLTVAILLLAWGAVSFHNLPVEAYPDVADNYVQVITPVSYTHLDVYKRQPSTPQQ